MNQKLNLTYRNIEKREIQQALELVKKVFNEFEAPTYSKEGCESFYQFIDYNSVLEMYENKKIRLYGCFDKYNIVGVVATRNESHIAMLFVDKEYHKKGIARKLVEDIIRIIKQNNLKLEKVTVNSSPYAKGFYKKLGFINTDQEQEKDGIKFIPMELSKLPEMWDLYDKNRKIIGSMYRKDVDLIKQGEYHIAVEAIIVNSRNEILISQRAPHKMYPFEWECNGGSILIGETSLQGILREIKEELGIVLDPKEGTLLRTIQDEEKHYFKDVWVFRKDVKIEEITFPDKEAIAAKWVTTEEIEKMKLEGNLGGTIKNTEEYYDKIKEFKPKQVYSYIGKEITVKIDRPLGSKHPKHDMVYPINYGYIPGTISGDGEELDCYILGVDEPVNEFKGTCIAVIYRLNDNDDKLIVVPTQKNYTDEEIRKQVEFQEKYFISEVIR